MEGGVFRRGRKWKVGRALRGVGVAVGRWASEGGW